MKRIVLVLMLLLVTQLAFAGSTTARIDPAGGFQTLNHSGSSRQDIEPGFTPAVSNLHVWYEMNDDVDVYAEFYLSSTHHLADVYDSEGYILIKKLPAALDVFGLGDLLGLANIQIKAGHFEVDFGNVHYTHSDAGQVGDNPLVGNYVMDPNAKEAGFELISTNGPLTLIYGLGNGVTSAKWNKDKGFSQHAKVMYDKDKCSLAASAYLVDHSKTESTTTSGLFGGNRGGSQYFGIIEADADAGQTNLPAKRKYQAYQIDASTELVGIDFDAHYGLTYEADADGTATANPKDEWAYYGVRAVLPLGLDNWIAAAYSAAASSLVEGNDMDASITRYQIGYGVNLNPEGLMLKVEYVHQVYDGFTAAVGSDDYTDDPTFSGIVAQVYAPINF